MKSEASRSYTEVGIPGQVAYLVSDSADDTLDSVEWCSVVSDIDTVTLGELSASDLTVYDVLWWHRETTLDGFSTCLDPIRSFVESGGGLLLSHGAVTAATALGIETHEPDCVEHRTADSAGFLIRTFYDSHPIFSGIDEREFRTTAPSDTLAVHYEKLVPHDADVQSEELEIDRNKPVIYLCHSHVAGEAVQSANDPLHIDRGALSASREAFYILSVLVEGRDVGYFAVTKLAPVDPAGYCSGRLRSSGLVAASYRLKRTVRLNNVVYSIR